MDNLLSVPTEYKNAKCSEEYIGVYKEDIRYFKEILPELNHWNDSQIVEFGDDYASMHFFCAMQPAIINREMLDMVIAINSTGKSMQTLGEVNSWGSKLKSEIANLKDDLVRKN